MGDLVEGFQPVILQCNRVLGPSDRLGDEHGYKCCGEDLQSCILLSWDEI